MYLVIDIGSNTVRAVIFRLEGSELKPVLNRKYPAGLASYIDDKECMNEEGIEYLIEILSEIKIVIDSFNLDGIFPFATASLRNINNSEMVLMKVREATGIEIEIISGQKEAFYDYYATIKTSQVEDPVGIVTDIGGGSTELVIYDQSGPLVTESIPIGSLNMFNKFVNKIMPTQKERESIYDDIVKKLNKEKSISTIVKKDLDIDRICGVGGSCRGILKLYNHIKGKESDNLIIDVGFLDELYKGKYTVAMLASKLLKVSPDRIHTAIPGAMILKAVADHFDIRTIKVNTHGVREGYLYYKLREENIIHE